MALMELIYSKLSILGYPFSSEQSETDERRPNRHSQCRISSLHFVCELGLLYGNRNRMNFPSTQFGSFVEVCLWLMKHSCPEPFVPAIDVDHDPPPMIAKRLLNLAQVRLPHFTSHLSHRSVALLPQYWLISVLAPWSKGMVRRCASSSTPSPTSLSKNATTAGKNSFILRILPASHWNSNKNQRMKRFSMRSVPFFVLSHQLLGC